MDVLFQCAKKTANDSYLIRTTDPARHAITFQRYKDVGKKARAGVKWKDLITITLSHGNPGFTQAVVSGPHLSRLTGKTFLWRLTRSVHASEQVHIQAIANAEVQEGSSGEAEKQVATSETHQGQGKVTPPDYSTFKIPGQDVTGSNQEACKKTKLYGTVCTQRPAGSTVVKAVSYWTIPYEHTYQQYVPGQPPSYDCSSDGNGGMFCDPDQLYHPGVALTRVRYHIRQLTLVSAKDGSTYLLECTDQESNGNRMTWRQALANGLYAAGQGASNALQDYSAGVQENPGSFHPAETHWPCYHLKPGATYLARLGDDITTVYGAKSVHREGDHWEVVLWSFNFRTAGQWVKNHVPENLLPSQPASTARMQSSGAPQTATAFVRSTPDGAHILVDGNYVGDTPSMINLTPGEHFIAIQKSGFETWQRKVQVTSGNKITISATLPPIK